MVPNFVLTFSFSDPTIDAGALTDRAFPDEANGRGC